MSDTEVSVVLAVRDEELALSSTLDSVLSQEGVGLECIVVDDGSTDATRELVRARALADPRVRLLEQPASGLTTALRLGCAAARGRHIARQDAGDRSLPGRLARLVATLEADPRVALTSGGTRFVGPEGEPLYEVVQTAEQARAGLAAESPDRLRGPSAHGCVVFRRAAYLEAGGYRAEFRVAQDLDLWLRLAERGVVTALPELLYEARFALGSISALRRDQQRRAARIAFEAARLRRAGRSDAAELARAAVATEGPARAPRGAEAGGAYFVGRCLRRRDPVAARRYFARAVSADPLHLRAWASWVSTALASGFAHRERSK